MAFPDAVAAQVPALERAWWHQRVRETFAFAQIQCETEPDSVSGFPTQQGFDRFFAALFDTMGDPSVWRVVEGAVELLGALRRRQFGLAIVSNFDFRLRPLLDELGIAALVDVVVVASDVAAAKPDPARFEHAIAQLRVPRSSTVVVGDHPEHDIAAARNAGLHAVDVASLATLGALTKIIEEFELR